MNVFIVRLCAPENPGAGIRAVVQRAGDEKSVWFTDAKDLVRYLRTQADPVENPESQSEGDRS
ncbi:MAG: hypothetical protein IT521_07100 [Burkholderiales bacterium]|nr:hypothetical protein [Burkholderiales bacterium]